MCIINDDNKLLINEKNKYRNAIVNHIHIFLKFKLVAHEHEHCINLTHF